MRTGGTPAEGEGRRASQNSPSFPRVNQSGRRGSEEPVQSIIQKVVQTRRYRYRFLAFKNSSSPNLKKKNALPGW